MHSGEKADLFDAGTAELFASPMGASTAGDVAHTQVRNAPLQGGLLGYFLATQRSDPLGRRAEASGLKGAQAGIDACFAFPDERPVPRRKRTPPS